MWGEATMFFSSQQAKQGQRTFFFYDSQSSSFLNPSTNTYFPPKTSVYSAVLWWSSSATLHLPVMISSCCGNIVRAPFFSRRSASGEFFYRLLIVLSFEHFMTLENQGNLSTTLTTIAKSQKHFILNSFSHSIEAVSIGTKCFLLRELFRDRKALIGVLWHWQENKQVMK